MGSGDDHETADVDISNQERAKMMNGAGVNLVLRLHCDGVDDSSVRGAMMLVPAGEHAEGFGSKAGRRARRFSRPYLAATGARATAGSSRGTTRRFYWSTVPVCNIEMGCLSNGDEGGPAYFKRLSEPVRTGAFERYRRLFCGLKAMNINLDYYKTFYYVARLADITLAAGALRFQPAVSQSIRQLMKRRWGCSLFFRTRSGVRMTPEGKGAVFPCGKKDYEQILLGEKEWKACSILKREEVNGGHPI